MATTDKVKLDWQTIDPTFSDPKLQTAYDNVKAAIASLQSCREKFETMVTAALLAKADKPMPAGKTFAFSYRTGSPVFAVVDVKGGKVPSGAIRL